MNSEDLRGLIAGQKEALKSALAKLAEARAKHDSALAERKKAELEKAMCDAEVSVLLR